MKHEVNNATLELIKGDITNENTEAIANAANSQLKGGGGVDGAIHRAGGSEIMKECRKAGRCPTGEAVITTGGKLGAKYVIHTVGPVYNGGKKGEAEKLAACYKNSLQLASGKGIKSIAFPSISTGVYRYPVTEAATVALETVISFLNKDNTVNLVRFVLFDDKTLTAYENALEKIKGTD